MYLLEGQDIGFIGELHPQVAADNDLKRTYVFELNYDAMMQVAVGYINYEQIPKFPGVTRDIALEVNHDVPSSELKQIIHNNGEDILQSTLVFDVYEGEHLEKAKISSNRLNYLDTEDTLTDERVSKIHDKILKHYKLKVLQLDMSKRDEFINGIRLFINLFIFLVTKFWAFSRF